MKINHLIFCFMLFFCLMQNSSAFTAKTIEISPSSNPNAGDSVTAKTTLTFPTTGGMTFNQDHDLVFSTDLDRAIWKFEISRNGVTDPPITTNGKTARVNGWILSYKSDVSIVLSVYLEGVVPTGIGSSAITAMMIQEVDSNGAVFSGREFRKQITIVDSATLYSRVQEQETALAALRSAIDSKARLGVDTSGAEVKYRSAQTAINSAKTAPTSSAMSTYLTNAQTYISESYSQLDLAWYIYQQSSVTTIPIPSTTSQEQPTTIVVPTSTTKSVNELLEEQNRKLDEQNRLLEEQNQKLSQQSGILDQILGFLGSLFGWAPKPHPTPTPVATPTITTIPMTTQAHQGSEKLVAYTAMQQGTSIIVTYQGGPDNSLLSSTVIDITSSTGQHSSYTYGSQSVGQMFELPGSGTSGTDHVIVTGVFADGSQQVCLNVQI